ncbi:hypothetical protein GOP47_0001320 [Adiantum capillus-veneris]|uniref:TF-B3 domain-containing protein n=1 Tax=Adiantum capillus-veneris TaxID=13818 RepID=A0A9D4ZPW6_ADICA|nr:hypothetical protein GOP47_0001320 [Adiantum capillus-veneris]
MAALSQGPSYVACRHCTQHCQQIHGQGSSSCSRSPSFFSLLPPVSFCAPCSLPIPPTFLGGKNIRVDHTSAPGEHLYSEVQLEGPSGATWAVAMQGTTMSNLAFTTGWEKFVKDHFLVAGDLLFFKLLSRGCFSVSVYGSDGCEKAETFTAQNSGAGLVSKDHMTKKRAAVCNVFKDVGVDADAKKRKVDVYLQSSPLIIDIEDDDDEDECKECAPKPQSSQVSMVQVDIAESRDTCMLDAEESLDCMTDAKEDKCLQPIPVDVPLTPSNADKGILQIRVNLLKKEEGTSDHERLAHNSVANGSEQETASSEEEDVEQLDNPSDCMINEEMSSESDSEKKDSEDSLYCTDEATQQDRMNDVKGYLTEAFISKRRPVSDEERQRALQAAKGFRSNLPHSRKLMLESHVYRGFWLVYSIFL